jgi:hypothetical protein
MAAIETYMQQKKDAGHSEEAWEIIDEFIREHFIAPTLDSNDISYIGPRTGIFRIFQRQRPST